MSSPENFKHRRELLFPAFEGNGKARIIFFSTSLLLHVLFFYGLVFFQGFKLPKTLPPVVQVDLVSFSADPVVEESPKSEAISKDDAIPENPLTPPPPPSKPREIPTIKPEVSLKTKPDNLKDLMARQAEKKDPLEKKKKTIVKKTPEKPISPEKTLEQARKTMEKKIEDQNQEKLAQALSRLQKKVKDQGRVEHGQGQGTGAGKKGVTAIDLYKLVLGSAIEQNWVFNDVLARMDQNLETRILIKILKSGEIRDIIYETRSGNPYLDDSAKKAIKKTNPLPPLPPGRHSYDVVVIFTPRGLK